ICIIITPCYSLSEDCTAADGSATLSLHDALPILGMLKPTQGTIEMYGKDVHKHAVEVHKHIAFVPGDINLWPNLTGGEIIDFFRSEEHTSELQSRFDLVCRLLRERKKQLRSRICG